MVLGVDVSSVSCWKMRFNLKPRNCLSVLLNNGLRIKKVISNMMNRKKLETFLALLVVLIVPGVGWCFNSSSKVDIKILANGAGTEAIRHSKVTVHYTGWLKNGKKFDSSLDRAKPFEFTLGSGQVIPGWDRGVEGMKVGEKRVLIIPPELAYGKRGAGGVIPPNAILIFDIQVLDY